MQDSKPSLTQPRYPYIPTWVLLLFCGYVIIWYLQIGYRRPALADIRFEFIYAAILSLFALNYTMPSSYQCPLTKHLILYFLVVVIQIPFSYNVENSWQVFVDRFIKFAFMGWFIVSFVKSPKGLVFFIGAFMLACMKMGQEGFIGQMTGSLVWQNQGVMRLHGSTPLYVHPNSFSGMALGTLPFIIAFFPIANRYVKALLAVMAVFAANIILFTGSRTGYVATVFLALFLVYKSKVSKFKVITAIAIVAIIVAIVAPEEYVGRFKSIYNPAEQAEGRSRESRIQIMKDAWAIFLDHPFGVGVGAFPHIRRVVFKRFQDTHNLYLEIATNLGIQGVIVFGLLIYKMLALLNQISGSAAKKRKEILEGLKEDQNETEKVKIIKDLNIIEASATAVYLFIIVRLGLGMFGMDLYEIYWWFASGSTIAIYNIENNA
jgi:O-antigen ligase